LHPASRTPVWPYLEPAFEDDCHAFNAEEIELMHQLVPTLEGATAKQKKEPSPTQLIELGGMDNRSSGRLEGLRQ